MGFRNPWNLLLLTSIIPVILLYLLKLRRKEFRVPSTLLWEQTIKDLQANAPLQKLKTNLLLFLQLLILIAASLAFAGPYIKSKSLSGSNQVLILDASLSMQSTDVDPSRFGEAQRRALEMIEALRRSDQMMVIEAGSRTRVARSYTNDKTELRHAVQACVARDVAADLREAVVLALSMSQSTAARTQIVVLSDGAFPPVADVQLPPNAELSFVKIGEGRDNLAVTSFDVRRSLADPTRYDLLVGVENFSDRAVQCPLTVEREGSLFRARSGGDFVVPPRERTEAVFEDLRITGGLLTARIDVADDLAADNVAHTLLAGRTEIRILLLSDGRNPFLQKALLADPFVSLYEATPDSLSPGDAADYDVVICDADAPEEVGPGNYLLFKAAPADGPVTVTGAQERPVIMDWDPNHPLTAYLSGLDRVRVLEGDTVELTDWARPIAETDKTPIIVLGERQGYRCIYVGFDPVKSDWVVRPSFPVFIISALEWLSADPTQMEHQRYRTGDPVAIPAEVGADHLVVRTPRSEEIDVPVKSDPVMFDETEWAGVYEVDSGQSVRRFVVNTLDRAESDIAPQSEIKLTSAETPTAATTVLARKDLWRNLLIFALFIMMVEWWAYHRRI